MPHPKKPASPKQLAIRRANAARSAGPCTPECKSRADLIAFYRPVNSQELFAIELIALAQESRFRVACLEAGLLTPCPNEALDPDHPLAGGVHCLAHQGDTWKAFLRYRAQAKRSYRLAIEEFGRLKALRHELRNDLKTPSA
jgi:hypothetical protein